MFANGERIQSHWLKDGDEVRVGDTFFQFQGVQMEQAHSITDQQLNLSEMGEETSWSKDLTLPTPDNRLVTDPGQSSEKKSSMMAVAIVAALIVLLVLVMVLVILLAFLLLMVMREPVQTVGTLQEFGNMVRFFVS